MSQPCRNADVGYLDKTHFQAWYRSFPLAMDTLMPWSWADVATYAFQALKF